MMLDLRPLASIVRRQPPANEQVSVLEPSLVTLSGLEIVIGAGPVTFTAGYERATINLFVTDAAVQMSVISLSQGPSSLRVGVTAS